MVQFIHSAYNGGGSQFSADNRLIFKTESKPRESQPTSKPTIIQFPSIEVSRYPSNTVSADNLAAVKLTLPLKRNPPFEIVRNGPPKLHLRVPIKFSVDDTLPGLGERKFSLGEGVKGSLLVSRKNI